MSNPPQILIVIPCLNEEHTLDALVRQLVASSLPNTHIVIADGGSTDATASIASVLAHEFSIVTLLDNPKRIQSAAINLAVEQFGVTADYLIRIDAHAHYPDDYCRQLVHEAMNTSADSVVVSMDTIGETPLQKAIAAAQNSKLGSGGSAHRTVVRHGKWVDHGHHALMRISAFRSVGGYDEGFTHNEDAELDTRLTKAGYKIWLTAQTRLEYHPRAQIWPLFKQYYHYGRGRIRNMMKHKTRPKIRQLLPVTVLPAFLLALMAPTCILFGLPLLTWAFICTAYGLLLGMRAKNPVISLSGPAAMIMHFAWSVGFWRGLFYYGKNL